MFGYIWVTCLRAYFFVVAACESKTNGGLLKVTLGDFFSHIGLVLVYKRDHPMSDILWIYLSPIVVQKLTFDIFLHGHSWPHNMACQPFYLPPGSPAGDYNWHHVCA